MEKQEEILEPTLEQGQAVKNNLNDFFGYEIPVALIDSNGTKKQDKIILYFRQKTDEATLSYVANDFLGLVQGAIRILIPSKSFLVETKPYRPPIYLPVFVPKKTEVTL